MQLFRKVQFHERVLQGLSREVGMQKDAMIKEFNEMMVRQQEHEAKIRMLSAAIDERQQNIMELSKEFKALQAENSIEDEQQSKSQKRTVGVVKGKNKNDNDDDYDDDTIHDSTTCSLLSTAPPLSLAAADPEGSVHVALSYSSELSIFSHQSDISGIPNDIKVYIDQSASRLHNHIAAFHGEIEQLKRTVHAVEESWEESAWDEEVWTAIEACPQKAVELVRDKLLYTGLFSS